MQRGHRIGVDLEHLRVVGEWRGIAKRSFSPREVQVLEALPEAQRTVGFFNCWTRKEALIKAHGEGVFTSLRRFEVSLDPSVLPRLLRLDGDRSGTEVWSLHHLEPSPGCVGALASDLPGQSALRAWVLDPDRQELPGI